MLFWHNFMNMFRLLSYNSFSWNSSGVFIHASEDPTGVLDAIEEKIAKATMLPREHYEVYCS